MVYKIEKERYGFKLIFGGFVNAQEMHRWIKKSEKKLSSMEKEFVVFVDMRILKLLPEDSLKIMKKGQILYRLKGMERSVVILDNIDIKMQFEKIAKKSNTFQWER